MLLRPFHGAGPEAAAVSYGTSNALPYGTKEISLVLQNNGVGPARLEAMEFLYE